MEAIEIVGPAILFLLMTVVGLELTPSDFRRVLSAPRAVVAGTFAQWVGLPLMTWGVVAGLELNPVFGAGAVLVAVAPGAGVSNILTSIAKANTALSVTLTAVASALAVVTLPAIAAVGMRVFLDDAARVEVPVGALIGQLLVSLALPIGLGMWLRARRPALALRVAPRLQRFALLVIALAVGLGVAFAPAEQRSFEGGGRALVGAALWTLAAMSMGWGVAAALRLPQPDRFTFLIEFSARNIAVATIVAMSGLGRIDLTYFGGVYVMIGYPLAALAAILYRRTRL